MEHLIKKTFYPAFLVFGFSVLFLLNWLLKDQVSLNTMTTLSVFVMIATVMLFERNFPFETEWNKSQGDFKADFILTMLIFPIVINVCRFLVNAYPTSWKVASLQSTPVWFQTIVGVLIAELLFYWIHRVSHENKHIWRFHSWHHSVKRVYWMNSGTLNPVDMFLNFVGYCIPFALIAMSPEALEYALFFTAITGLLEHANVNFSAGRLNYIFNTAELHRWHHSVVISESQKNYGKALSVWDLVFGTYHLPSGKRVDKVGIE